MANLKLLKNFRNLDHVVGDLSQSHFGMEARSWSGTLQTLA